MIKGIGTDLVKLSRIEAIYQRFGNRFAQKILTPEELQEFVQVSRPVPFLAKRFAAKEAAAKALGTGFKKGINLSDISVTHQSSNAPILVFHGEAKKRLTTRGVTQTHITISDETDHAIAFVVFE